jgi:hypothetical protein
VIGGVERTDLLLGKVKFWDRAKSGARRRARPEQAETFGKLKSGARRRARPEQAESASKGFLTKRLQFTRFGIVL